MRISIDGIGKAEYGPVRASFRGLIAIVLLILVASQLGSRAMMVAAQTPIACLAD